LRFEWPNRPPCARPHGGARIELQFTILRAWPPGRASFFFLILVLPDLRSRRRCFITARCAPLMGPVRRSEADSRSNLSGAHDGKVYRGRAKRALAWANQLAERWIRAAETEERWRRGN
jgi:hypothetical protein